MFKKRFVVYMAQAALVWMFATVTKARADADGMPDFAGCSMFSASLETSRSGGGFILTSDGYDVSGHRYTTQAAADMALQIFEFNGLRKYCSVDDGSGVSAFEYFLNINGQAPRTYNQDLEKCEGF